MVVKPNNSVQLIAIHQHHPLNSTSMHGEKSMETIGVGVIGCSGMGKRLATSAHAIEGIAVICVSDAEEALAKKLATDLGAAYTSDYHELLADNRIHAVLIATGSSARQIAADTAEAGKYNFFDIDPNLSSEEIQRMLIEHLL